MKKQIEKIKSKTRDHKTLVRNFSYLSALQVFNMLIPLITYPYLIRVLGKDIYGLVVFAQAIVGYLGILISFGFDISAVKDTSIHRDDPIKLSEIVSSITILKGLLFIVSFIFLFFIIQFFPQAQNYRSLFYITMFMSINLVLFPSWYFQGIEQMKYITYINLIGRLTFIGLMFLFIHTPSDYLLHPLMNGIGSIIAGLVSFYIIFKKHKIKFAFQNISTLKKYLVDSFPIFISNVSIKIYVSSNRVILGTFVGMAEVAYYDLGEKIVTLLRTPQSIISQTLFPKINKDKNIVFVKKVFWMSLLISFSTTIFTMLLSKPIVMLLGGIEMIQAIWVVNILVLNAPIVAMSNIFGIQMLIPFGYNKTFTEIIVLSGLVYLLQLLIVWPIFGLDIYSISIITVTTEIFVTLTMFLYCKKYHLW